MMNIMRSISDQLHWDDLRYRIPLLLFVFTTLIATIIILRIPIHPPPADEVKTVLIYCFSAMEEVMEEAILPAFTNYWDESTGEQVKFITNYSGSGLISNRVFSRFRAQIIILASEMDAYRLADNQVVGFNEWQDLPEAGKLCYTPMIIYSKKELDMSNRALEDLDFNELEIVITDPTASGAGYWALLAMYGSKLRSGGTKSEAVGYMDELLQKLKMSPLPSKAAFDDFMNNNADLLISYEVFGLSDDDNEQSLVSVYPIRTIAAEPVVIPVFRNIMEEEEALLASFVEYLWSWEAQSMLMDYGFRVKYENIHKPIQQNDSQDIFRADSLGDPAILFDKIINSHIQSAQKQISTI